MLLTGAAPVLLLRRGRHYLPTLRGRLGLNPAVAAAPRLWVHAVSVGEVGVAATLIRALPASTPLVLTTVTPTGQAVARRSMAADRVAYLPFDLGFAVRRFLDALHAERPGAGGGRPLAPPPRPGQAALAAGGGGERSHQRSRLRPPAPPAAVGAADPPAGRPLRRPDRARPRSPDRARRRRRPRARDRQPQVRKPRAASISRRSKPPCAPSPPAARSWWRDRPWPARKRRCSTRSPRSVPTARSWCWRRAIRSAPAQVLDLIAARRWKAARRSQLDAAAPSARPRCRDRPRARSTFSCSTPWASWRPSTASPPPSSSAARWWRAAVTTRSRRPASARRSRPVRRCTTSRRWRRGSTTRSAWRRVGDAGELGLGLERVARRSGGRARRGRARGGPDRREPRRARAHARAGASAAARSRFDELAADRAAAAPARDDAVDAALGRSPRAPSPRRTPVARAGCRRR